MRRGVRTWVVYLIVCVGVGVSSCAGQSDDGAPAVQHALAFVYSTAADKTAFAEHGYDLLWCFFTIANTAQDPALRKQAAKMGRELAQKWRQEHPHVPASVSAADLADLESGAYAADRLGVKDSRYKAELRRAATRFTARAFLGFDAPNQPPNPQDPERYDVWSGALIITYFGDAYGIKLGAHYSDVVKWLPRLRPYHEGDESLEFDEYYAITHLIYTLNRYGERRVAPAMLPEEIAFLKRQMKKAIADDDPEKVGEGLDCLKAAGFEDDPLLLEGKQYLLSSQRPDGTWAGGEDDIYTAYHSAWTGIDGLRDYRFRGKVKKLPTM